MLNKLYFGITLTWRKIKWDSMTDFKAFLLFYLLLVINIINILMFISIISKTPFHKKMNTIVLPNVRTIKAVS
jgi:competence protein ComGC